MTHNHASARPSFKKALCYAGFFGILAFLPKDALAAACASPAQGATLNISADCTDLSVTNDSTTVTSSAIISPQGAGDAPVRFGTAAYNSTFTNSGTISSSDSVVILDNYAKVSGSYFGITSLTNTGTISNDMSSGYSSTTINNRNAASNIGSIINRGTISANTGTTYAMAIANGGSYHTNTIDSIVNGSSGGALGVIRGDYGIYNSGIINSVMNYADASIVGAAYDGIGNLSGGSMGTITNEGSVSGNNGIQNYATITSIINNNPGSISGTADGIDNETNSTITTIQNSGSISSSSATANNAAIYNNGAITNIINNSSGSISGVNAAIYNESSGTISTLQNSGSMSGTGAYGIYNGGAITTLTNNSGGLISGKVVGINNDGAGTITTLNNDGIIRQTGGNYYSNPYRSNGGITNFGTIGTLNNTGTVTGVAYGIYAATGPITTINNASTGIIGDVSNTGYAGIFLQSGATIGDLANPLTTGIFNHGSIAGAYYAIGLNPGSTITNIHNYNSMAGSQNGINNLATILNIENDTGATLSSTGGSGIQNNGTIGDTALANPLTSGITNAGTISGPFNGIFNSGTITGLQNIGGTISASWNGTDFTTGTGGFGLLNTGTTSSILNTGTISGGDYGVGIANNDGGGAATSGGTINILSNFGVISAGTGGYGVDNTLGTITTLNNAQGGSNALVYKGNLPTNYNIVISSPSSYGKLAVSTPAGTTTFGVFGTTSSGYINGTTAASVLAANTTYASVLSGLTSTNLVNTVGTYNGYSWTLQEQGTSSVWDLVVGAYSSGGSSGGGVGGAYAAAGTAIGGGNPTSIGAALDRMHSNGNSGLDPVFTALTNLGTQSAQVEGAAIRELGPTQLTPQVIATNLSVNQTTQVIGQHQETLLSQNGSHVGKAAGSEYQSGVFWGQMIGGVAYKNPSSDAGGYSQSFYGMTVGADNHLTKDAVVGGAVSWVHSSASGSGLLDGSKTDVNSVQLTAYGTHRFGPAFVDAMAGVGVNLFDQSRPITFLGETAKANYVGMQYSGKVDAGWDFDVDPVTVTPIVGFQAIRTVNSGYTETGSSADVSVARQRVNSYTTTLGGKVATTYSTGWGTFTPELKLSWAHDLKRGPILTSAAMAGVGFTTATPRAAADAAQITLATGYKMNDDMSMRVEYSGDIRTDYTSHTGLVKLLWNY